MPSFWGLAGGAAAEGAFQPARPVAAGRVSCLDFARSDGRGLLGHCECVCVCGSRVRLRCNLQDGFEEYKEG